MKLNVCKYAVMPVLALAITAAPALAEGLGLMRVTIPFQFIAGKAVLPAGEYKISQDGGNGVITITGLNGGAMVLTNGGNLNSEDSKGSLSFEKTEKGTVLKELRVGNTTSSILPAPAETK